MVKDYKEFVCFIVVATRKGPVTCNENGTSGGDQGNCVPAAVMQLLDESEVM